MKKSTKLAIGIAAGFIVLFVLLFTLIFSILNKQKNADFYSLGNDQIVSVKNVVGVRNILGVSTSIENGVSTKTYHYKSNTSTDDIELYLNTLIEKEGFIPTSYNQDSSQPVYAKDSVDTGKIIILSIVDSGFGYTLTIQKGEGTLNTSE